MTMVVEYLKLSLLIGVLTAAGRVARGQAGADDHLCIKQLAGDSAMGETGEALGPTLGEELQPLIDAIGITSMLIILVSVA